MIIFPKSIKQLYFSMEIAYFLRDRTWIFIRYSLKFKLQILFSIVGCFVSKFKMCYSHIIYRNVYQFWLTVEPLALKKKRLFAQLVL